MVLQNRLTEQINSEVLRLMSQLLIDPNLAMVIVLPADRIIAKQETPPHCAVHHMHNRNFIRGESGSLLSQRYAALNHFSWVFLHGIE